MYEDNVREDKQNERQTDETTGEARVQSHCNFKINLHN